MINDENPLSKATPFEIPEVEILPYFGIHHLTIPKAADLLVRDMWYSGHIAEIEGPGEWDTDDEAHDPKIKAVLANHKEIFEKRLLAAIDSGKLKAALIKRDFDEQIKPEKTHIA